MAAEGRLVLAGGGHSHALVLRMWAMARRQSNRRPPAQITLVSRHSTALYSGMVPGLVAGLYDTQACSIDLRRLCRLAGVTFVQAEITGLDPQAQELQLEGRPSLRWDWLSLDVGAETIDTQQATMAIKPLEPFLQWCGQHHQGGVRIRGGGAAAVEVALALRARGLQPELLLRGSDLHLGSRAANQLGKRLLQAAGITLQDASPEAPADLACTGSRAPRWLAASGLPSDPRGRLLTGASLQVLGHPGLFASGDCGVIADHPRPPSGVWAVRCAPSLAHNLTAAVVGRPLRPWRPQRWALQLLGDGGSLRQKPQAVAFWGPWAIGPSPLLWRWKHSLDQRFMARFSSLKAMDPGRASPMACRGCAAKLAASPLQDALARNGLGGGTPGSAEDAAVIGQTLEGSHLLQSVDGFPALVDDAWLNARLTTLHACSDLWACGARVTTVQAVVTLPELAEQLQADLLSDTLAGIQSVLAPLGARLIGGHTLEARDGAGPLGHPGGLSLVLSVNGCTAAGEPWAKGPLRPGDGLLLSRPIGSGVLFAAAMAGRAQPAWIDAALLQMQQSQAALVELLARHGCRACTDVTGFGLLGHLGEMLAASPEPSHVRLKAAAIPALAGALPLLEQGWASSLAPSNASALALLEKRVRLDGPADAARQGLLIDPQTCGPLLAAIPADQCDAALAALQQAGFAQAALIGQVHT
ncbi:selenide, water dikinase SelD [Cyanobium sp. T1B-Tous]|uniref:selenide, water dikinase SelD n=1 Tax=Cyanobium sp. T1B-Tous TaxID=2823721 RepID=UPI0020CFE17F|nr:selenide, water dikinase SelD [Cyanobium sp. T1B-Tous]MCP9805206.1 selenide, water dikinase SelD [Cyanobium sp. T1B-Tous]